MHTEREAEIKRETRACRSLGSTSSVTGQWGRVLGVEVSGGVVVGLNVDEAKWITEPFLVRTESAANQFTVESFLQKRLRGGPGLEWRQAGRVAKGRGRRG